MGVKVYSLDSQLEAIYMQSLYAQREDNRSDIKKMHAMVSKAMLYTLTERQRQCLTMYYFEKRKIPEIAEKLGLHKSTVSRHIKAAGKNLQKLRSFV